MSDFNLGDIVPRLGGKREAFEELCCQLARRSVSQDFSFIRLHGAGGDGGVECFADSLDGKQTGWQAKYVFDIDDLLTQASTSLTTALAIHTSLTRWILCFPFDLTGPTGRKAQSGAEKFEAWKQKQERAAKKSGRRVIIEAWPKSKLLGELLKSDNNGGIRAFFFDSTILTHDWFLRHLAVAEKTAGPRYTKKLRIDTNLWNWFSALAGGEDWSKAFEKLIKASRKELDELRDSLRRRQGDAQGPAWPVNSRPDGEACAAHIEKILTTCSQLAAKTAGVSAKEQSILLNADFARCLKALAQLDATLKQDLESQHGAGTGDSIRFRQFMAEYQVSFPMASLDTVREVQKILNQLATWFSSPGCWPAFESSLLLTGIWGSGKTHGICDAAIRRLECGQLSVVVFGHAFAGEPNPWSRFRDELALPVSLTRDGVLDLLNSAAEASGHSLIIWVDAINETKPQRYWRGHLAAFADAIAQRPFLRLCVSCRTSYTPYCVPDPPNWYQAEHKGFLGNEHEATQAFFDNYNLDPPRSPILPPEFANPLYLRLACETLQAKGLKSLPPGWVGLATVIRAFLDQKNTEFALEFEMSDLAQLVPRGLQAVAREIAAHGETTLSRSAADQAIRAAVSIPPTVNAVDWLVRENLLIEDVPKFGNSLEPESTVRPAFERLGDFLVAQELLSGVTPDNLRAACQAGGRLAFYFRSPDSVANNEGLVSALSMLVPEQIAKGIELPDFFDDGPIRTAVVKTTVSSYTWRDPSSFSASSQVILRRAFNLQDFGFQAMDAALTISCQPSAIDAFWVHKVLSRIPMARRDAFWCGYLHQSFEGSGPVKRLIDAALEQSLSNLGADLTERWATILLWFTAAADRRVKDNSSRAAIRLLRAHIDIVPNVVRRMLSVDDDAIRERALLVGYGTTILARGKPALNLTCDVIAEALNKNPDKFHHALLRDHTRCLAELEQVLARPSQPRALVGTSKAPWPLDLPSDDQLKSWKDLPRLECSCLEDDFFVYSLNCLDEWGDTVPKLDMGKWILRRIVEDFRYAGSGCEGYDGHMLNRYGGGRSKPAWAERIGKKYQWIAMYQLAARLSDHLVRNRETSFRPNPIRQPLILLEERQFDPTLQESIAERKSEGNAWWVPSSVDLAAYAGLSDSSWVSLRDDIPELSRLLVPIKREGKEWILLNGHLSWNTRPPERDSDKPYRDLWIQIRGYFLQPETSEEGYSAIAGRNFFGRWMPEGAEWLHGFVGEYPWGAAYNIDPESYHRRGGHSDLPCDFMPACDQVVAEWEYDASLPQSIYIPVPARVLFEPGDLWWNGKDGFLNGNGQTVFRAPNVTEAGPPALFADSDDLLPRLARIKKRLIWTLLGEKWILRGRDDKPRPSCTFSQTAMLEEDGSLRCSALAFFDRRGAAIAPTAARTLRPRTPNAAPPTQSTERRHSRRNLSAEKQKSRTDSRKTKRYKKKAGKRRRARNKFVSKKHH
jgi:hypothetical protein